jgi:hypothetical protein
MIQEQSTSSGSFPEFILEPVDNTASICESGIFREMEYDYYDDSASSSLTITRANPIECRREQLQGIYTHPFFTQNDLELEEQTKSAFGREYCVDEGGYDIPPRIVQAQTPGDETRLYPIYFETLSTQPEDHDNFSLSSYGSDCFAEDEFSLESLPENQPIMCWEQAVFYASTTERPISPAHVSLGSDFGSSSSERLGNSVPC